MRKDLPTGTVTFVFTDVEGSTRLLDQLGVEAYGALLAEHHRVCREAWAAHGGVEIDTAGDAFFVAFSRPSDALAAAAAAQGALASAGVRVRMGVHTGEVAVNETGYVGMEVHRAARIAAAGHGGQVLVSSATAALVETPLTDLGEHRFKDLRAPERVFQLGFGEFPPLKSLYRSNLPAPTTPFLGREAELSAVVEMLSEAGTRLVSLIGPGGTGKTRLALQAAAEVSDGFPDGVFWVPLAPLRDPQLILSEVSAAVGVRERESGSPVAEFASALAGRRLLVFLDNIEHLLPEARGQVGPFVAACPTVTVVVTSRERLQLPGERVFPVPPMSETDAETLFRRRAADAGAEVAESDELRTLCARLDNLPLALELAAARMVVFTPAQLLERLSQELDLLGGRRGGDGRHETLRATIAWSHDLRDQAEQQLFRRLSVFAGSCSYDSAEQVADAELDTLQSLLDKSLLRRRDSRVGPRFWMLETIHQYARERLEESGETDSLRRRHAERLVQLGELGPARHRREESYVVAALLESEVDDIRAAMQFGLSQSGDLLALRLTAALAWFWGLSGRDTEGLRWAAQALEHVPNAPDSLRVKGLHATTAFASKLGDRTEALRAGEEALVLYRATRNDDGVAGVTRWLAHAYAETGDLDTARTLHEDAVEIREGLADPVLLAGALRSFGEDEMDRGDPARAVALLQRAVDLARSAHAPIDVPLSLHSLGDAELVRRDTLEAAVYYLEALRSGANRSQTTHYCLAGLAAVGGLRGNVESAGRLWGAVESYLQRQDVRLDLHTLRRYQTALSNIKGPAFSAAVAVGKTLTLEQAVDEAVATYAPGTARRTRSHEH